MTQETLKLALEALELSAVTVDSFGVQKKTNEAITAIKEALAQEQEPVATLAVRWHNPVGKVAYVLEVDLPTGIHKLYTHPPQRTWMGLTSEEVANYWDWEDFQCGCGRGTLLEMVRDIEAKLKERNT